MFSFTGDSLPVGIIFLAVIFAFLCYAATGIFSEFSRRNALLKDLQIIKLLRENPKNAEGLRVASEYEARVVKRIDSYNHGTNKAALTLGFLVRWVPYLFITIIMWAVMQGYAIYNSTFNVIECIASFIMYCLSIAASSGGDSAMRQCANPLAIGARLRRQSGWESFCSQPFFELSVARLPRSSR